MVVVELKCQSCGNKFETQVLDRENPREQRQLGSPVRCPKCRSSFIERIRAIRKAS